jgi:predicted amidohydrolase YtcJ
MLIRNAELYGAEPGQDARADVRISDERIAAIGRLQREPNEQVLDAAGGALLPGLHDHHIHLLAYAASLDSIRCGPPAVQDEEMLITALQERPGPGWLRGYGYHDSVAGEIDRSWLDEHLGDRPVRIQHRSGRLWILNSLALETLAERQASGHAAELELPENGRLYDADASLGALIGRELPPVALASQLLAGFGVTGLTDMTPGNDADSLDLFAELRRSGVLRQHLALAGAPELPFPCSTAGVTTAATKIHLHDSALPEFDALCATIRRSHEGGRPIAVHCVTEVELVFTLAAIQEAGTLDGDRIEHASVTPPALLEQIADLELTVVTQPNFVAERGDAYLRELPGEAHGWLYRGRAFREHGIPLAGGTDAPFGGADPWIAIEAAVRRETAGGLVLGLNEALTPEEAIELFLGDPAEPANRRQLDVGARADLCLLDRPWRAARDVLNSSLVAATFCAGERTY